MCAGKDAARGVGPPGCRPRSCYVRRNNGGPLVHAYKLNVNVADDHRLAVDLPADFPSGPAEVIVLAVSSDEHKRVQIMGSLGGAPLPPDTDPVADALAELRGERTEGLDAFG